MVPPARIAAVKTIFQRDMTANSGNDVFANGNDHPACDSDRRRRIRNTDELRPPLFRYRHSWRSCPADFSIPVVTPATLVELSSYDALATAVDTVENR